MRTTPPIQSIFPITFLVSSSQLSLNILLTMMPTANPIIIQAIARDMLIIPLNISNVITDNMTMEMMLKILTLTIRRVSRYWRIVALFGLFIVIHAVIYFLI